MTPAAEMIHEHLVKIRLFRVKTTRRSLAPIKKRWQDFVVAIPGKVVEAFDGPEVPEVSVKAEVERIFDMGIGWGLPKPWQQYKWVVIIYMLL